jgi:rare lipoprotein A
MPRLLTALSLSLLLAACASTGPGTPRTPSASSSVAARHSSSAASSASAASSSSTSTSSSLASPGKGAFYKDDGPGDQPPPDMASIPDAQPRHESLHSRANRPYVALGQSFTPQQNLAPYHAEGIASWYGRRFHGKPTSSGEKYDMYAMTAAHPTLPIPSYARVASLETGKSVIVRINDRGPFHKDRVIDLSYTAAFKLGYANKGSARVVVDAILPDEIEMLSARPAAPAAPPAASAPEPVVAPTAPPPESPAVNAAGIYLQLGAFGSRTNAEGFREHVRQALHGLPQALLIVEDEGRARLQLGPFASIGAANDAAERIADKLKLKPFVVRR